MDKIEAQKILSDQMMEFKKKSRSDLVNLIGDVWAKQIKGKAPNEYNLEIEVFWDHEPDGDVRIIGSIDDGGFRSSFSPLSDDFIVTPDGKLIDWCKFNIWRTKLEASVN